jgi:hypothetical protein
MWRSTVLSLPLQLDFPGITRVFHDLKTVLYEKTLVAWFKLNLLLNIAMYNMSSLYKNY